MSQPLDPTRCPLCGQPNQCSLARGDAQPCWCFSVEIDPEALRQAVAYGSAAAALPGTQIPTPEELDIEHTTVSAVTGL